MSPRRRPERMKITTKNMKNTKKVKEVRNHFVLFVFFVVNFLRSRSCRFGDARK